MRTSTFTPLDFDLAFKSLQVANQPARIALAEARLLEVTAAESESIRKLIQPPLDPNRASPSFLLHVLRVHGVNAKFESSYLPTGQDVLASLTSSERGTELFGRPAVMQTAHGWRFPTRLARQSSVDRSLEHHRDQNLASLAELGVPLDFPLRSSNARGELRDVLRDSIGNFHLGQQELPWTALAYALYLPPCNRWTNRFGESYTFDDVVMTMINCRLDEQSCGGTHVMYSLTAICRVDQDIPVLSGERRRLLWKHLRRMRDAAVCSQQEDGSWSPDWNRSLLPADQTTGATYVVDDDLNRLIMTGHLAEWMLLLPDQLAVPNQVLINAAGWLRHELLEADLASREKLFCPMTHGASFLRKVIFVSKSAKSSEGVVAATKSDCCESEY